MSVSRFSSVVERCLWSLLIRRSKLKNYSTQWQSLRRVDELNRIIILPLLCDLIERSVLNICDYSWVSCLFICASMSLSHRSTTPFGRPSTFPDFLHSLTPPHYAYHISLRSVQDTIVEGVLSSCRCSLSLTLTTSKGLSHSAGATKSWSSLVSLFCSWRMSFCIRSSYDSRGWATRIIHFNLLVFSTVSITLIHQETISLAIRNYSFGHPIEGMLTFRNISPVVTRTKRVSLLYQLCTKSTL